MANHKPTRRTRRNYKKCVVYIDPSTGTEMESDNEFVKTARDVLTLGCLGLSLVTGAVAVYNHLSSDDKEGAQPSS